ncbi:MAG: hypothetical protein ACI80L_001359 [Pseudohongiellaceae bacterium]|jgi:hypothetical protein
MSNLKTIRSIANCYKANNLCLSVLPEKPELADQSLRDIQLKNNDTTLTITVFDEYKDTEIQNPILWLHLILDTCQSFEEASDYDTWRKNEGYQDTPLYQSLYQQLSNTIPKIRDIIGSEVTAIDYHHIEFNTDIAKALREYKL